ncbi:MAG: FkbM family methyltransferase [Nitrososphaerales archaeon]
MWEFFKPKKGEIVIDVGAHIGKYSLPIANLVGKEGLVISIEPYPINYEALIRGIKLNHLKNII